jgi:hypothetical protein
VPRRFFAAPQHKNFAKLRRPVAFWPVALLETADRHSKVANRLTMETHLGLFFAAGILPLHKGTTST